jgi:thiol-disulfide isomerase/thioredoxin
MRKLLLTFFLSSTILLNFAQKHKGPINWLSIEEASVLYQKNPKPMFIDVYTDWCGWCKKMDASTFKDASIAQYLNSNFYAVKLNAETSDSLRFMGKTYYNTQQEKVKFLLDSLKKDLLLQEIEIKKNDSAFSKETKSLDPKISFLKEVLTKTENILKDSIQLKAKLNTNYIFLKNYANTVFENDQLTKEEFQEFIKKLKATKNLKGKNNVYSRLNELKTELNLLELSLEKINKKKKSKS